SFSSSNGTVTFAAGNATATVTIDPTADIAVEPDETVILTVTPGTGYLIGSPNSATTTILNDDADFHLVLDESGRDPRQAAAVDSILFMRDPFKVTRIESWLSLADPNTHVLLSVTNLQLGPGETPSNIVVTLADDSGQVYEVP